MAFKRISTEPVDMALLPHEGFQPTPESVATLGRLATVLTGTLGFEVTAENALSWLLKGHTMPDLGPTPEEAQYAALDAECKTLIAGPGAGKIFAIKKVREVLGIGLKEAKDFVEARYGRELAAKV